MLENTPDAPTGSIRHTPEATERIAFLAQTVAMALNRRAVEEGVRQGAQEITPNIVDAAVPRAVDDLLQTVEPSQDEFAARWLIRK